MSLNFFDDLGTELADVDEIRNAWITDPGAYAAKVTSVEDGHSKAGDPMLTITYEITEGSYAGTSQKDRFTYVPRGHKDYDTKMGYIKARFVDLGMPPDYKGPMDPHMFDGVEVILNMVFQRAKDDGSHINSSTGKPYVQIGTVARRDAAKNGAPVVPPKTEKSFFGSR